MSTEHEPQAAGPCRNCGMVLPVRPRAHYCPRCGQETALHPPTLGEFVHEFVGHYVALEGALWRTLKLLLLRPGQLTCEYLAGRRRHYVLPLRLYLTASFLFFVVLKLLPGAVGPATEVQPTRVTAAEAAAAADEAASVAQFSDCGQPGRAPCGAVERFGNRVGERFKENPREFVDHLSARVGATAPYAVFLMLPAFAGIVMLAYRRRHATYGEHFVFSLHLHALWFLLLLAAMLLPRSVGDLVILAAPVYTGLALRRVYGGRWGATLLRALFIGVLYGLSLLFASLGLLAALLAFA